MRSPSFGAKHSGVTGAEAPPRSDAASAKKNLGDLLVSMIGRTAPRNQEVDAGFSPSGSPAVSRHDESRNNATMLPITVRSTPAITWPAPDPITFGSPLTAVQLNASASVAGSLVYTPRLGYKLPAGTHSLWVTFTPAEASNDAPLQASVSIVVNKATPALSWTAPAEITNGVPLSQRQLNATASVPGAFEYMPALGEVLPPGTHTLSVTFTPADTANYSIARASVRLKVALERPAIDWHNPEPIQYGTLLDASQLNARTFVEGSFDYHPRPGDLLAAGEHRLSVVFTPADTSKYSPSRAAVALTVAKATPAITWCAPDQIAHGAALTESQLNASAATPGTFAYTPAAGEVLAPGVHTLSVTFTPDDRLDFTPGRAAVSLTVTERRPVVIDWASPLAIPYGAALNAEQLNAKAPVPGTFVYTPSAGHILAPGIYTLSASFTPSDSNHFAAAQAAVTLEVIESSATSFLPATGAQTWREPTLIADSAAPKSPLVAEMPNRHTAPETKLRETRIYKGAVYERGEDRQWHLRQR